MTRTVITACPLDCPDACTLAVDVEGEATGGGERIVRIDAAPATDSNPLTDGWICAKVRRSTRRVHSPERILTPLRRTGPKGSGAFEPISWDDALELVATEIRSAITEHGPAAVVPFLYNSSAPTFSDRLMVRLVAELGTSEVAHTICAYTGTSPGTRRSRTWRRPTRSTSPTPTSWPALGANPSTSNTHLTPLLTEARGRGAAVVVIDPRRTDQAQPIGTWRSGPAPTTRLLATAELDFRPAWSTDPSARPTPRAQKSPRRRLGGGPCSTAAEVRRRRPRSPNWPSWSETRRPGLLRLRLGDGAQPQRRVSGSELLGLWVLAGQFGRPGSGVVTSTSSAECTTPSRPPTHRPRLHSQHELHRPRPGPARSPVAGIVQGANPAVSAPTSGPGRSVPGRPVHRRARPGDDRHRHARGRRRPTRHHLLRAG